jgi:Uma2 family endonuclease
MRLDSAQKKSRPQYISAQKISTLFDALRAIARKFSDARAFTAVPVSYYYFDFTNICQRKQNEKQKIQQTL